MKCYECGGNYVDFSGDLELESNIIGKFSVPNVNYKRCKKCNDLMLSDETWEAVDATENRILITLLEKRPISDYISAAETASILGMSKQGLHKNKRIKNGFIFSIRHSGTTEYLRLSVLQYKKTGDGRFPLYSDYKGMWGKLEVVVVELKKNEKWIGKETKNPSWDIGDNLWQSGPVIVPGNHGQSICH